MSSRFLVKLLVVLLVWGGDASRVRAGGSGPGNLGNLWCLGDSWSDCFLGSTWRRRLAKGLVAGGWKVNFVGTRSTHWSCEPGHRFDRDHNGIAGMTAREVLDERLDPWLDALTPDTVLLLIGGNDLDGADIATAMNRIGAIIDRIRIDNPDVVIHAAIYGYVGVRVSDATVDDAAGQLQTLIATRTTARSPIHFVDHRAGWDKSVHLNPIDRFHPSPAGMARLAANWLDSIVANQGGFLPSTEQYRPDQMIGNRSVRQAGANRFSKSGIDQRIRRVSRKGRGLTFYFSTENDGNRDDVIALKGTRGNRCFSVAVFARIGRLRNVTGEVLRGAFLGEYEPGETIQFRLKVAPRRGAVRKHRKERTFVLRATSRNGGVECDAVRARAVAFGRG